MQKLLIIIIVSLILVTLVVSKKPSKPAPTNNFKGKKGKDEDDKSKRKKTNLAGDKPKGRWFDRKTVVPQKKVPLTEKALKSFSEIGKTLQKSAETAKASVEKLNRDLKEHLSSDFEVLLLRMTRPDDSKPSESDIDRFFATTESFVRNLDLFSESNPYRVTLRKLWAKIAEPDCRTALKALYLLHTLLKFSDPEDAIIYKKLIVKMSKEYDNKTKSKYFDLKKARSKYATKGIDSVFESFLIHYFNFVMKRAKSFTSEFEEMKLISRKMRIDDICAQLVKAIKLKEAALSCKFESKEDSEVIVICLELVAKDLKELFQFYAEKVNWVLKEEQVGDIFNGWPTQEINSILSHFKQIYNKRYNDIQKFLLNTADVLESYKIPIETTLNVEPLVTGESEEKSEKTEKIEENPEDEDGDEF